MYDLAEVVRLQLQPHVRKTETTGTIRARNISLIKPFLLG
jgi:hypothetical protein